MIDHTVARPSPSFRGTVLARRRRHSLARAFSPLRARARPGRRACVLPLPCCPARDARSDLPPCRLARVLSSARTGAAWPACVLPLPCRLLETKLSLQLEDLPKATAIIDALRTRLSTLRDTVVDGSRNFWVHLAGITSQSAEARRCSNHRTARSNGRFHAASCTLRVSFRVLIGSFLLSSSSSVVTRTLALTRAGRSAARRLRSRCTMPARTIGHSANGVFS